MPALHELVTGEAQRGITAVLGPTNTGKTHLALERMLRHRTGMIGLPLRLLAREVFDKLVDRVGEASVALITGEEKIVPNRARYFVCTVEAMPDRAVHFLAVDEVQLAAHRTRGHVFTDRLMRARGLSETLFLGSATARGIVQRLVPTAEIMGQPRLSKLRHAGHHTLKRLPPRSAVVAFSTERVYEIAERVRQKHGGAAIVLGALSPRTRNAQVDLYQNGDVPVLVATDAIGMGLNLDVNHVAFAATRKFDGRSHRSLHDDELAQIAGRAGRFLRDGTFGTTGDADSLDPEVVDAIEQHQFTPIKRVWWRNPDLEFSSVHALLQSLEKPPRNGVLKRMTDAEDHRTLLALTRIDSVARRATTEDSVRLLWEVAAVPDYRNSITSHYAEMLGEVFGQLEQHGELDANWIEERLARLDRTQGDIDALMARIAHVRTWTYISHKRGWNADPTAVQERARQVEDRLSDALHASLTARFVDHRVISLPAGLVPAEIRADDEGRLCVDGVEVGRVVGLALQTELGPGPLRDRVRDAAVRRAQHNALDLVASPDDAFAVDQEAQVLWKGHRVARWERGEGVAKPKLAVRGLSLIGSAHRAAVSLRLRRWTETVGSALFQPPERLRQRGGPAVQQLLGALQSGLGLAPPASIGRFTKEERNLLARSGIRLGHRAAFSQHMLKPRQARVRQALFRAFTGERAPASAKVWSGRSATIDAARVLGMVRVGRVAVRVDVLETVAAMARKASRRGPFALPPDLPLTLETDADTAAWVLGGLGYGTVRVGGEWRFIPQKSRDRR